MTKEIDRGSASRRRGMNRFSNRCPLIYFIPLMLALMPLCGCPNVNPDPATTTESENAGSESTGNESTENTGTESTSLTSSIPEGIYSGQLLITGETLVGGEVTWSSSNTTDQTTIINENGIPQIGDLPASVGRTLSMPYNNTTIVETIDSIQISGDRLYISMSGAREIGSEPLYVSRSLVYKSLSATTLHYIQTYTEIRVANDGSSEVRRWTWEGTLSVGAGLPILSRPLIP